MHHERGTAAHKPLTVEYQVMLPMAAPEAPLKIRRIDEMASDTTLRDQIVKGAVVKVTVM